MRTYTKSQVDLLLKKENEVWLYSYADLITNLLAFFLMLLAISKADPAAIQKVRDSISKIMGPTTVVQPDFANVVTQFLKQSDLRDSVGIEKTVEGISLVFEGGIFFESGSAVTGPKARSTLDRLVPLLLKLPDSYRIDVEGHTDSKKLGEDEDYVSNWELSASRAGSIVRYLVRHGLDPKRIRAIGYADTRPISDQDKQNRRVVIRLGKGLK